MNEKLLFVDDEPAILTGIERRLGLEFDITTADSGASGLDAIRQHGPFAVVITDMRMPNMDGVEFVEQAREVAPDSVFIMLTGNQDQQTAIRALNDGQVFRFLTKPAERDELRNAVDAALRQHRLECAERDLLNRTFVSAVRVLTDVVAIGTPELVGRGDRIEKRVEALRAAMEICERWEFRLAGRLSTVGVALAPVAERRRLGDPTAKAASVAETLHQARVNTNRMIRGIPRLESVAEMFNQGESITGAPSSLRPKSAGAIVQVGATLVQVAERWDHLASLGLGPQDLHAELVESYPDLPPAAAEAISSWTDHDDTSASVCVAASELRAGMVIARDVTTTDGAILLRAGRRLTETSIEKLREQPDVRPVEVADPAAALAG